ncbi:MAG: hypothetical protein FWB93_05835 [Oscillospiraceae bacterium]|nr:hypothetical protein [Oscillospiraceae bacterium]
MPARNKQSAPSHPVLRKITAIHPSAEGKKGKYNEELKMKNEELRKICLRKLFYWLRQGHTAPVGVGFTRPQQTICTQPPRLATRTAAIHPLPKRGQRSRAHRTQALFWGEGGTNEVSDGCFWTGNARP